MTKEKNNNSTDTKVSIEKYISGKDMIAKKDFYIVQNKINIKIKKGDDIAKLKIPERFLQNLKTEKII